MHGACVGSVPMPAFCGDDDALRIVEELLEVVHLDGAVAVGVEKLEELLALRPRQPFHPEILELLDEVLRGASPPAPSTESAHGPSLSFRSGTPERHWQAQMQLTSVYMPPAQPSPHAQWFGFSTAW